LCTIAALIFVLETRTSQPKDRRTAFPSNGTDYDYMVYVCMYVIVNNDEMPTAPPLRPEAADAESSARPLVSGLWDECVAGGRDGSVHMADARGNGL
jgi:hypothetical protein